MGERLPAGTVDGLGIAGQPGIRGNGQTGGQEASPERLGSFLLRRGFSYTIARQVTKTLWEETHGDAPDEDADDTSDDDTLSEE